MEELAVKVDGSVSDEAEDQDERTKPADGCIERLLALVAELHGHCEHIERPDPSRDGLHGLFWVRNVSELSALMIETECFGELDKIFF